MGDRHSYRKSYEELAPKIKPNPIKIASGVLVSLGKPLSLIFFYLFLAMILNFYITGHILNKIFKALKPILIKIFDISIELTKKVKKFKQNFPLRKIKKHGIIFVNTTKKNTSSFLLNNLDITYKLIDKNFKILLFRTHQTIRQVTPLKDRLNLTILKFWLSIFTVKKNIIKILVSLLTTSFIIVGISYILFWFTILRNLPSVEALTEKTIPVSTKIYDRNGILLYTIFKDQNRTPVPLSRIPLHVRLATIAVEDAEFYSHPGFSIKGIFRAILKNIKEGKYYGGSTITQQLVKNTLLNSEKTLTRKLKEIILAIKVELTYNKDEILEMYLNQVPYGGTVYGIQEAARYYFNKDVERLTLAEASFLAGLPKSPSNFSPFGPNPESAIARQKHVLALMKINGFINEEQQKSAENEEIKFAKNKIEIKAPHFVFYVKEILEEKYGKGKVENQGLTVTTSLDYQIQELAENVLKEEIEKLSSLNVTNGAVLVLDPKTGEILAMVGSKDYFDTENDGNVNVTIRPRQPGSSIKVVNYAYALSNGMTLATIISDSPTTFLVDGQKPYTPKNYEGGYRGNLTLRSALAESRNIPAVKILASYGVEKMIDMGRKMGITTWENPANYGLSLTLGGGEVKLIDLARVYATLANYGIRPEIRAILKISDYKGKVLEDFNCEKGIKTILAKESSNSALSKSENNSSCEGEKILDPRVAFLITDTLKDNKARSPTFGLNSLLVIPNHEEVAVKTGTSNNLRDNLTVGYTQDYVVAVWVGNNNNSEMARIASGITGATPIWNKIMSALLTEKEKNNWPIPEGLVKLPICPYTGTLACEGCPTKMEWFLEENKPEKACKPEWFKKESQEDENKNEKKSPEIQIYNLNSIIDKLLEPRFGKKRKHNN